MQLQNGAEDHHRSSMMSASSLPPDALGRPLQHWTWPTQAYHCSFCTRVFRTAQALGGHMNIHRRERACIPTTTPATRPPHLNLPPPRSGVQLPPPLHELQLPSSSGPRPSCNGGYGKLNLVENSPPQPRIGNSTISEPLTWLFSQLPPPGNMQGSNMRSDSVKPYHRGLAVCKSPPGVRRHVCRIHTAAPVAAQHVLYTGLMQSRSRGLENHHLESSGGGADHHHVHALEESALDLELRL